MDAKKANKLSRDILIALILGILLGSLLNNFKHVDFVSDYFIQGILEIGSKIFLSLLKMIVVPVVLISLICGTAQLSDPKKLGRMAGLTLLLYLFTTAIAITLALAVASLFNLGAGSGMQLAQTYTANAAPSLKETLLSLVPHNILYSLSRGNMLQIIFVALFFGLAIALSGTSGKKVQELFESLNEIVLKMVTLIMQVAPLGVLCLVGKSFATVGIGLIQQLGGYFFTVLLVLLLHFLVTYGSLCKFLAKRSPLTTVKQLVPAFLFSFSTSSSSASIPVVLKTCEEKLGLPGKVASFCIPLGATINMDGTAIMQGVATVFIANLAHVHLGFSGYCTVILTATLSSIGTAGVPGVGLVTLAMVLKQVNLPVSAIGLILGVDRLLDMARTAVNIGGDCVVAAIVARHTQQDQDTKHEHTEQTIKSSS